MPETAKMTMGAQTESGSPLLFLGPFCWCRRVLLMSLWTSLSYRPDPVSENEMLKMFFLVDKSDLSKYTWQTQSHTQFCLC